jgi:hypothetical protein
MNIKSKLKSTFYKAYKELSKDSHYQNTPDSIKRSFAACVAIFCHDNIDNPLNQRMTYLTYLLQFSGGPTIREHYCNWKAMSLGDGIKMNQDNMTAFEVDPRLPNVGTWTYSQAYNFCLKHIFAPISFEHYQISLQEPHFDDPEEDLVALDLIKKSSIN